MTERQENESPVDFAAFVIREALGCSRPQCTPDDHAKFVSENMRIAHKDMTASTQ